MLRILLAVALLTFSMSVFPAPALAISLLTNGGFESGLTGWTTSGLGTTGTCPGSPRDWNVASSGTATGCSTVGAPLSGSSAAYVMNDGTAGTVYELSQTFVVPSTIIDADIFWSDSIVSSYVGASRTFEVQLYDQFSSLLGTIFSLSIPFSDFDASWTARTFDITSLLAPEVGNTVELRFVNSIPELWTGPAGLGLDVVSVVAVVPEPSTALLLASGLIAIAVGRRRRV